MKKRVMLAFGILIAVGLLLMVVAKSSGGNASASAAPDQIIKCPASLVAPYGGNGWSTIQVQANFAAAAVTPQGLMTCQYGFTSPTPTPFFGIQRRCPPRHKCVVEGNGFRITPLMPQPE
jgi:hypothetical protein